MIKVRFSSSLKRRIGRYLVAAAAPDVERLLISCLEGQQSDVELVGSSKSTTVYRFIVQQRQLFFKRFDWRDSTDILKHVFRVSRAERAHRGALLLEQTGFAVPRTIGVIEKRAIVFLTLTSGLLSEAVEGGIEVRKLLASCSDLRRKRSIIYALAREVARLHAAGIVHGDTNLGNILCTEIVCAGNSSELNFTWVDTERVCSVKRLSQSQQLTNLRQLNKETWYLSSQDRLRFWRTYSTSNGASEAENEELQKAAVEMLKAYWSTRALSSSFPNV